MAASLVTSNAEETIELGRRIGQALRPGDALALEGDLGAGKTTLVRGLAAGLGLDPSLVHSPTFAIVNHYDPPPGRAPLIHVDAYRLSSPDELATLALDSIAMERAVLVVEWPERAAGLLPASSARIQLQAVGLDQRRITLDAPKDWLARPGIASLLGPDPANPNWPFASPRERLADLYKWLVGAYSIPSPPDDAPPDLQGEHPRPDDPPDRP